MAHHAHEAAQPKTEKTRVPAVYRRGDAHLYTYRVVGRQRWGRAPTLDDARRTKRRAEGLHPAEHGPEAGPPSNASSIRRQRLRLGRPGLPSHGSIAPIAFR